MTSYRYTFPKSLRLGGRGTFKAIRDRGSRASSGSLTLWAAPNEAGYTRLGISIGRPVGTAPRRNRIKRLLRESFRLGQHDFPGGYDLVIAVRPHEPLGLEEYRKLLSQLIRKALAGRSGVV